VTSYSETVKLDIPAMHKHVRLVGICVTAILEQTEGIRDRETTTYAVQLAAHEACINIVDHAYAQNPEGRIALTMTLWPDLQRFEIGLSDTGQSFDLTQIPAPDLNQAHEHGYGLFLVRNLMDEVTYKPEPGNNRWHLVKYL